MKKKKFGLLIIPLLVIISFKLNAHVYPSQYIYTRPIIYIFWSGPNECYECQKTISLTQSILKSKFSSRFGIYVINYKKDLEYNYTADYNLKEPLSIVMINIVDGANVGQKKFLLETTVSDPISFEKDLIYKVENFLG